ncbi:hypothetical protein [Streptomyces chrestomyceticus]|uniref:hypothetical protein n=1 Tax=Streptomyces chrestomyceticus TaxID=68185 RepID=UPI0033F2A7D5
MDDQMNTMPSPLQVGARAREILVMLQSWPEFARLEASTLAYPDCWGTYTGYTTIQHFDLAKDAQPLWLEAQRVMAMKTAVFEITGQDERAAELIVPAPVDEMVHALLAQHTLARRFETETGLVLVHMTDRETFGWEPGDYTHQLYVAAWGAEPPERYWIPKDEAARRHRILDMLLSSIGITDLGRAHHIGFTPEQEAVATAAV